MLISRIISAREKIHFFGNIMFFSNDSLEVNERHVVFKVQKRKTYIKNLSEDREATF